MLGWKRADAKQCFRVTNSQEPSIGLKDNTEPGSKEPGSQVWEYPVIMGEVILNM